MCGIAGLLIHPNSRWLSRNMRIQVALEKLSHRGPEGVGLECLQNVIIGHRRLSIIDLAGGSQPLHNEDRTVWVTFNGEIYNFQELKEQLIHSGHAFRTNSDTEVIVHAWEEWGKDCVNHFRGMFAFAILDQNKSQMFLARDHLGIKPLYYFIGGDSFAFASELQSLRSFENFPNELDIGAIDDFLVLGYVPAPRTIYRYVKKLPPACSLLISTESLRYEINQYWRLDFHPDEKPSTEEWKNELANVLRESVKAHLISDVPFGAFLSGGVDSTAVVSLMSEFLTSPVKTFAIGFEEEDFNELSWAREAARQLGTDHYEEIVRPDALSILPELVKHYGEPFGDSSAIPTWYVSQLAGRHVKMALTGDGGDEAFLGYGRYGGWKRWVHPIAPRRTFTKQLVRSTLSAFAPQRFPKDIKERLPKIRDWYGWVGCTKTDVRERLWKNEFRNIINSHIKEMEQVAEDALKLPAVQFGQYVDYLTYLPNDILTKVDIASMAHSLETRTPLVDIRVAELAARIPWRHNLQENAAGQWTGKHLLKSIVSDKLGSNFVNRRKMGFCVPLKRWFTKSGALHEKLRERLTDKENVIGNYFSLSAITQLLETHSDESDHSQVLWQLLFLDEWLRNHSR